MQAKNISSSNPCHHTRVSRFTEAETRQEITHISKAIDIVLAGGKSYSLSDGQGSQQITRSSLAELQNALNYWRDELEELTGNSGIVSLEVDL